MRPEVSLNHILIVDDDAELRQSLRAALADDFHVDEAADGVEAMEHVQMSPTDLVLLDMDMPRMGGMETLRAIKKHDPRIVVLILTAYSTVPDAVAAVREGAYNYVAKPVRRADIRKMLSRALEAHDMVKQLSYSAPELRDQGGAELSSQSGEMNKVFSLVEKLATVDTHVLLRGESGTGKEVVARAIHYNSLRKEGRFVAVNLSAVPENLIESELFGHEKGAFTGADQRKIGKFQYADGGTLFLDEVGDISPSMQVKLLRVLQEKKFMPVGSNHEVESNVRIIAATNRNLEEMMQKGVFREDLFYRLSVLPIFLPPLRERKEDLETLVRHFMGKFNEAHQKSIQGIDEKALKWMKKYDWPGNIRELENVIEHAFVLEGSQVISEHSLPDSIRPMTGEGEDSQPPLARTEPDRVDADVDGLDDDDLDYPQFKEQMEKEFIIRALRKFHGRINQTSQQTKMSKKTLLRKIEKYGINAEDYRK